MSDETIIPDFKNEFSRNIISNSVYFLFNFLIGLLLVPFYIDSLGLAAYGIIPLATTFAGYVMLILDSLSAAISRFLTIHIQKSDRTGTNQIFNTSFFTIIAFVVVFTPVSLIFSGLAPNFFNIPDTQRSSVFLLFSLIIFSSFIGSVQSPFSAIMFSFNKIHYTNCIAIFKLLLTPLIIVILFYTYTPSVIHIGIAYFVSALFSLCFSIVLSRKVYDKIRLSTKYFSREQFFRISDLAKWILVDQIGTLLLFSLSLIIVNKEFGTAAGGEYAIVLIFFNLLWSITGLITSVLSPMYYTYFARGMFSSIHTLSMISVKCIGLFMALPIALICIFSPQLLTIWVGEEFSHLSSIIWILLIPLTMIIAFRPLILSYAAYNQVRIPAYATIIFGLFNLVLAVFLSSTCNFGLYGIAIAFVLALWLRYVIFTPWYAARIQGVSPALLFTPVLPGSVAYLVLVVIGIASGFFITIPASIVVIAIVSIVGSIVYFLLVISIGLSNSERDLIRTILPPGISEKIPTWIL